MKLLKQLIQCFTAVMALVMLNPSYGASWGVAYAGWGFTGSSCNGSGWYWDPVFYVHTSTEPADWPAVSEFGQAVTYPSSSYSESTTNNANGVTLGRYGSVPSFGPNSVGVIQSYHWATYNGSYIDTYQSASGPSSPCM